MRSPRIACRIIQKQHLHDDHVDELGGQLSDRCTLAFAEAVTHADRDHLVFQFSKDLRMRNQANRFDWYYPFGRYLAESYRIT